MYALYFLLWVIFNGQITLEICIFGIIIATVIFAFTCKFMDYSIEKEKKNIGNIFRGIRYIVTLIIEIFKANVTVVGMILSEREEVDPVIVDFETDLKTPAARAFLANAITLTPGTITVSLEENEYTVHCLDESLADGIDELVFQDLLRELESEDK
ncbi:MAG: Na+/H+ antiporter subunit E [Eubacteriales bacterium]|nr:Na+/H+ antiporter subunit E [Eubacteriales bacterium]